MAFRQEGNVRTTRNRRGLPPTSAAAFRKVAVRFSGPLFREIERVAAETGASLSKLIRCAVEQYLEAARRNRLEQELAAGYVANAAVDRGIAEEFSTVDYETLC